MRLVVRKTMLYEFETLLRQAKMDDLANKVGLFSVEQIYVLAKQREGFSLELVNWYSKWKKVELDYLGPPY
jgi:hypothetical protein